MTSVFRILLKNIDPSLTPVVLDITLAEGGSFEYRENNTGSWPPGYFFFKEGANGTKSDYSCFVPASSVLAITSKDLI